MEKLFISCPMRARTAEQIHATMDQMHKIRLGHFLNGFTKIPQTVIGIFRRGSLKVSRDDLQFFAENSLGDCFIGIFDDQKAYDGCIIENHVAKLYGVPQYLVNIAYVAPDILEQRLQNMV